MTTGGKGFPSSRVVLGSSRFLLCFCVLWLSSCLAAPLCSHTCTASGSGRNQIKSHLAPRAASMMSGCCFCVRAAFNASHTNDFSILKQQSSAAIGVVVYFYGGNSVVIIRKAHKLFHKYTPSDSQL